MRLNAARILINAGADPTLPPGDYSPLARAKAAGYQDSVRFMTEVLELYRVRALHKARCLIDAGNAVLKAGKDAEDAGLGGTVQQEERKVAAAPVYLKGRVERGAVLPSVVGGEGDEGRGKERAAVAFVLGMEEGGKGGKSLPDELYEELIEYMVPSSDPARRGRPLGVYFG